MPCNCDVSMTVMFFWLGTLTPEFRELSRGSLIFTSQMRIQTSSKRCESLPYNSIASNLIHDNPTRLNVHFDGLSIMEYRGGLARGVTRNLVPN